jgi:bZIP transcription factor
MVGMTNAEKQAAFRNRRDAYILTLELRNKALATENATLGNEIARLHRYQAYLLGYIQRNVPQCAAEQRADEQRTPAATAASGK